MIGTMSSFIQDLQALAASNPRAFVGIAPPPPDLAARGCLGVVRIWEGLPGQLGGGPAPATQIPRK